MKKLEEFMNILEYRTKKTPLPNEEIEGKKGKAIGELNPETDNTVMDETGLEEEDLSENEAAIQERFDSEKPFFVLGHAGWAKTSIIKRVAKRNGYEILVVYLDKAVKEDLGGIPIAVDEDGEKSLKVIPPDWAKTIIKNPDRNFLLFFDEMNQADPEVMNALMPIVQDNFIPGVVDEKGKPKPVMNFIVGAAGNYHDENKATHELSGPLLSRFKPLIIWEDNNDAAWEDTFNFYHKKYDSILGKDFIDAFWEYRICFDNPRELNEKLWDKYINVKNKGLGKSKLYTAERIAKYIYGGKGANAEDRLIKKDMNDQQALKYAKEMAEIIYEWLNDANKKKEEEEKRTSGRRSVAMSIPENVREMLETGIPLGYIDASLFYDIPNTLFIVAEDNIYDLFDPEEINAESIKQFIKQLNRNGIKFKYAKAEDGLNDPELKQGKNKLINPANQN